MMHPRAVRAIGLCLSVAIAGCALAWGARSPRPGSLEQILLPAGTVFRVPGSAGVVFQTPSQGRVVVGEALVQRWTEFSVLSYHGVTSIGGFPWPQNNTTLPGP